MAEVHPAIDTINPYEVGNHPLLAERVFFTGHIALTGPTEILRPITIRQQDYEQALEDINKTYGSIQDPETGQTYEIAVINPDAPAEEGLDIEYATEKSSLTNNPGNAPEFAANSAVHPRRKRVYVASPGSGLSSDFDSDEHTWIRQSGRLTHDGGKPLPTFLGLTFALEDAGLSLEHGVRLSANSAGAAYARGLMAALPPTVSHAYFKNTPGITDHRLGLAWSSWDVIQEGREDRKSAELSQDMWKLTPELVEAAKEALPNVYGPENKQQTKAQQARTSHSLGKLVTSALLLARGGEAKGDPVAADTAVVLSRQPNARLTHHFSLFDRLYNDRGDMLRFLEQTYRFLGDSAVAHESQLELLITSGTHRDHTNYPRLRWSAEVMAFDRPA